LWFCQLERFSSAVGYCKIKGHLGWALLTNHTSVEHESLGKDKGNISLYRASSQTPLTSSVSDMDHTVLPATTPYLPVPVSISEAAPPSIYA